ncbi:MAG TPA: glycosyltransferase 87 family protein [Bryobacteraceae bacterium]|jgi:hypothetical protein
MPFSNARRWLAIGAAIFALCFFVARYYRNTVVEIIPELSNPSDFLVYHQAAQHIVKGESPFLADGYIYPPLLAFALTPLATLDYVTARRVWFAGSQLFLIASAILLWRRFGRDWSSACWIAFVWAFGDAAGEALGAGQVGPFLTFLVVLVLTASRRKRGAAVALGFAIKLFPGLLGAAILLRREKHAVRSMIAGAATAILLPWLAVVTFLRGPSGFGKTSSLIGTPATLSWSVPSVALRIFDPARQSYLLPSNWMLGTNLEHFRLPAVLAAASMTVSILTLAGGLFALIRSSGFRIREAQLPWALSALTTLALVAAPISWTHYQVLEYPGVALILIDTWRRRQWTQLSAALVLAALIYPMPKHILDAMRLHWTGSFITLFFWTAVPAVASVGLMILLVKRAAQSRALTIVSPASAFTSSAPFDLSVLSLPSPVKVLDLAVGEPLMRPDSERRRWVGHQESR